MFVVESRAIKRTHWIWKVRGGVEISHYPDKKRKFWLGEVCVDMGVEMLLARSFFCIVTAHNRRDRKRD